MMLRKLNEINDYIANSIAYYEDDNGDYAGNYLDFIGDQMQYDGIFTAKEIDNILESNLTTKTDYSYWADDAVATFHIGEIEEQIETGLTKREYDAIEGKLHDYAVSSFKDGILTVYICSGMNVRVYSDYKRVSS